MIQFTVSLERQISQSFSQSISHLAVNPKPAISHSTKELFTSGSSYNFRPCIMSVVLIRPTNQKVIFLASPQRMYSAYSQMRPRT